MICSKNGSDYNENHPEGLRYSIHHMQNLLEILFMRDFAFRKLSDFDYHLEYKEPQEGLVPDSTFFCFDEKRNLMVGAVNIRHDLNDYLLKYGGHIGDGIRPSERRKGYATEMIRLALEECRNWG